MADEELRDQVRRIGQRYGWERAVNALSTADRLELVKALRFTITARWLVDLRERHGWNSYSEMFGQTQGSAPPDAESASLHDELTELLALEQRGRFRRQTARQKVNVNGCVRLVGKLTDEELASALVAARFAQAAQKGLNLRHRNIEKNWDVTPLEWAVPVLEQETLFRREERGT